MVGNLTFKTRGSAKAAAPNLLFFQVAVQNLKENRPVDSPQIDSQRPAL